VGMVDRRGWLVGDQIAMLLKGARPSDVLRSRNLLVKGMRQPESPTERPFALELFGACSRNVIESRRNRGE
jgi:hypothetical protein